MAAIRITRQDQSDVRCILDRGGPWILLGQMAFRPDPRADPLLYEVVHYDRTSDTYRLLDPVSNLQLRFNVFAADLYIGEDSREMGDPILELLDGSRINPAPYLKRRPDRVMRASPPKSPARGFRGPRREMGASLPRRLATPPPPPAAARPPAVVTPAMSPASLLSAPLVGPRGPYPPSYPPGFAPPPYRGPPGFGFPSHPYPGGPGFAPCPAPGAFPPLPAGPPPASVVMPSPSPGLASGDPALVDLQKMVKRLQSETRAIRSGGKAAASDLSAYAVGYYIRKLHGATSIQENPGLHSQMSMGLELATAPPNWSPFLALGVMCVSDVKLIDMKFSWLADGIFTERLSYLEAAGEVLTFDQKREIERKVINFHRQERAKAVALVAKYPHLYGKNKYVLASFCFCHSRARSNLLCMIAQLSQISLSVDFWLPPFRRNPVPRAFTPRLKTVAYRSWLST
jgi:hypothetical protein